MTATQAAAAVTFAEDDRPLPRFHSLRFSLTLPLPDGKAWRIDDHSRPELVATHAPTRSRLVLTVFHADTLVGRTQCEDLARTRKLVPDGDVRALRAVEDQVAITQGTFDTRVEVALQPGSGPDRSLAGHVMAFGGFLRKCYVFIYSTEVDSASDEAALSSRLAFVRARVLGGLELEPFDAVRRDETPTRPSSPSADGPKLAPGP
ncbi:MAG TPA: hypothetical protein VH044_19845 [Polyangiaceae bacterium]|nr:hypothetical protein [Polyangiaceae bacterium]